MWNMPPRLPHFVGRSDLLDDMARRLAASGRAAVCGVQGLGGVGKTALAVEYAHQHAAEFDAVWWIPAEDPDLIPGYISALGVALGLPDGAAWPSVAGALRQEQRRWLLVLDNVEDLDVVGPFQPTDAFGHLLVTSRRSGLTSFGQVVEVAELSRDEAVLMLSERVVGMDRSVADEIARLLGDLPLAVEQAIGFLTQTGTPPKEYAGLLTERLADMLSRGWVANRPQVTVANLWELSLTRLQAQRPAAVRLLELCAFCAPEPIPLDLFSLFTSDVDDLPAGPLRDAAGLGGDGRRPGRVRVGPP